MKIKCAAIQYNGKIYEGRSHCEIGWQMLRDKVCKEPFPSGDAQGFVTECGIFVDREVARNIAITAGQVIEGQTVHRRHLFSEDLRRSECSPNLKV